MSNYYLIVPASGIGTRMAANIPKQYLKLDNGFSVLDQTLKTLLNMAQIKACVVAIAKKDIWFDRSPFAQHPKLLAKTIGGKQRYHSVMNALNTLTPHAKADDWILVHDAARPCVKTKDVLQMMAQLKHHPVGGILATPVVDTIKQVHYNIIGKTLNRDHLWQVQTPQMYRFGVLFKALKQAIDNSIDITDESSAIEYLGLESIIIPSNKSNIKITNPEDLDLANFYLNNHQNAD